MKKSYEKQTIRLLNWKSDERKGDKLYIKWKGYDSSFNSWIHKSDIL